MHECNMNRTLEAGAVCGGSGTSAQPLLGCSACAGDYEDPDRTAGTSDLEDADESEEEEGAALLRLSSREETAVEEREMSSSGADGGVIKRENSNSDDFPARET
jgi:hypothetical protein